MSELKFACPICGQHITAASSAAGSRLECPTCFRQLIIPAPPAGDSKFVVTAVEADRPRPVLPAAVTSLPSAPIEKPRAIPLAALLLVLGGAIAVGFLLLRDRSKGHEPAPESVVAPVTTNKAPWASRFPVPESFGWSRSLTNLTLPTGPVAGRLNGHGFRAERSTLTAGILNFRQGGGPQPDLSLTIFLPQRQRQVSGGHLLEVSPDQPPPTPRVVLRWKDYTREPATNMISRVFTNGYALRLELGKPESNRITGRLYVALPDQKKSFLGGDFTAEIRQPPPRKK